MGSTLLVVLLFAVPAIAGVALVIAGWRGRRIDDHPLCRRCGYDLHLGEALTQCPECGADLRMRSGPPMRIGHRRRRKIMLAFGVVLLIVGLGGGGLFAWSIAGNIDWYAYKPLWLLRRDAAGSNPQRAIASQSEIVDRAKAGLLAKSQIDAIVSEALAAQRDPGATWFAWWGDVIEIGFARGEIDRGALENYIKTAVDDATHLRVRPETPAGLKTSVQIVRNRARLGSGASGVTMWMQTEWGPFWAGEREIRLGSSSIAPLDGGTGRMGTTFDLGLPPGEHAVAMDCTFSVAIQNPAAASPGPPDFETAANLLTWSTRRETTLRVIEDGESTVTLTPDGSLALPLRSAVRPSVQLTGSAGGEASGGSGGGLGGQRRVECIINVTQPPVNLAFEIWLRSGDRQWRAGTMSARQGESSGLHFGAELDRTNQWLAEVEGVDVILRSSADAAEQTVDIFEIWDGEIVIEGVKVERPPSPPNS